MKKMTEAAAALMNGGIGVLPTDTIYGLVGSALRPRTVARIYRLRKRNLKKPAIILVASPEDVRRFGARLDARAKRILDEVWPGKVSVILPCRSRTFAYLHRGTRTLAFRLPRPAWLRTLLARTGPLIAPSANVEGRPPARTVREAKKYFGRQADFYLDRGRLAGKPSTLVAIKNGGAAVLREGAVGLRIARRGRAERTARIAGSVSRARAAPTAQRR